MASAHVVAIFALLVATVAVFAAGGTNGYTNHTVGGDAGWLFNSTTNKTSANYDLWTANQTFNLGDYLIFNTNTNQTVIQTYNETTYRNCNIDDTSDSDVSVYGDGGNQQFSQVMTIAIPLTIEGPNYYFSYPGDDPTQCENGMAFTISVQHGLGLPPDLNQPPPPPYTPPASPSDAQSPTGTVTTNHNSGAPTVGANFGLAVYAVVLLFGIIFQF